MREILFRGKRADNGEWVEGVFSPYNWNIFGGREEKPQIIIFSEIEDFDGLWCEVIPETVGQYTGLTDKNGRKIFEGDVVCFDGKYGKIVHDAHYGDYQLETDSESIPVCYHDEFVVRGNVYDDGYYFLEGGESNGPV